MKMMCLDNPAVKQHLYNINRYKDGLAPATLINNPIGSQPFKIRICIGTVGAARAEEN